MQFSIWPLCILALMATSTALGQLPTEDPVAQQRLAYLRGRMERYRIHPPGLPEREYRLQEALALRWSNPVSGVVDGGIFVWTDGRRPMVFAKSFINETMVAWGETIQSVAPGPLVMTLDEREVWKPAGPGITFHPVEGQARPAASEGVRLGQMRSLLRRLELTSTWGEKESSPWSLRMLTTPVHRYQSEPDGIVDGAVFAFTQGGTNPEAIALVEAVKQGDSLGWQIAVTRLSQYASRAELDKKVIADHPRLEKPSIDETFYRGWHWFSRYPFPKSKPAQ